MVRIYWKPPPQTVNFNEPGCCQIEMFAAWGLPRLLLLALHTGAKSCLKMYFREFVPLLNRIIDIVLIRINLVYSFRKVLCKILFSIFLNAKDYTMTKISSCLSYVTTNFATIYKMLPVSFVY